MRGKSLFSIVAALAVMSGSLFGGASSAQAASITMGGSIFMPAGEADPVGGTVVASRAEPFSSPTFTGLLLTTVISGDATNPYGGLTFTYLVTNDLSSAHPLGRFTANGFDGWLTDASWQAPSVGTTPALINRPTADFLGFTFLDGFGGLIAPGKSSALLVIQTDAPSYVDNFASVIDGFVATVPTYSPAPEPATLALLTLGGLALAMRRRS